MKKLLYIPAAICALNSLASFVIATHALFWLEDYGKAAMFTIFIFTGVICSGVFYAIAYHA